MKRTGEKVMMIAENNRGNPVTKMVEVLEWNHDRTEPTKIVERKAKRITGSEGLFDRYMYVSVGRCTSVTVGKATKHYDMASFSNLVTEREGERK
jgi:hypothetical protein